MTYLTERQRDVLNFISKRIETEGVAPTLQEIADAFGFRSTASAQKHVAHLERKGFLRREKHQKRGLVLPEALPDSGTGGGVTAFWRGRRRHRPSNRSPVMSRSSYPPIFCALGITDVLRVRGDSMIGDGVHDGDLVVVQRSRERHGR